MEVLLAHLDMLAKQDLKTLMDICGVDQADLADMIADIRMCNPKPGQAFRTELITTVVPDVLLQQDPAGGWHVELNGEALPKILVNNTYYAQISRQTTRDEDKTFITEAHQTATWLVKSLHQRATTILKVATEIVRQQDMFFAKGVAYLKPLVLRDVAEVIGMHESTVSRVTSNKYIETPRGIYELKYFFTQAIASADGQAAISAEAVRHKIKTMIDGEDPKKILSDDKLVELLKADGIDIARRTVAKYREALKIPSSVQRRKQKKHLFSNA
jgi:RNA polymerase sigma-54 factor